MRKVFLIAWGIGMGTFLYGQTPTLVTYTTPEYSLSTLSPSRGLVLEDPHYPVGPRRLPPHLGSQATVALYVDDSIPLPDTFSYQVELRLTYYGAGSPPPRRTELHTLTLSSQQDYVEVRLLNAYRLEATILRVWDGSSRPISFTDLPPGLKIRLSIAVEVLPAICLNETNPTYNLQVSKDPTRKLFTIRWNPDLCAEFYELEWIYVDDYGGDTSAVTVLPANSIRYTFFQNAMRVRVRGASQYQLPMVFDRGYVLFRVRSARAYRDTAQSDSGVYYPTLAYRYLPWSSGDGRNDSTVANFQARYPTAWAYISESERWEPGKNWEYTFVTDEKGQGHHLIAYYDGLFLKKQEVKAVHGDSVGLVQEWFYDVSARPSVTTLPTVERDPVLLRYYPNLHRSASRAGQKYSYEDFSGVGLPAPMDTVSGAARYYSGGNPYVGVWDSMGDFHRGLARAAGYPFVLQRHTPEPTPRLRESGLAGDSLMAGGPHASAYFYGTPLQAELDRLLGNHAGFHTHYVKTLTKDPNGVVTTTIQDLAGRTILQSVARNPLDTTLLPIQDTLFYLSQTLLHHDALNPLPDTHCVSATTFPTLAGLAQLSYDLSVPSFQDTCLPSHLCLPCVWDLHLRLTNTTTAAIYPLIDTLRIVGQADTLCPTSRDSFHIDATLPIRLGELHLSRTLKLNSDALGYYFTLYLNRTTCVRTWEEFLQEELSQIDTADCYLGCESCTEDTLPRPTSFASCAAACDTLPMINICDQVYPLMLSDMNPTGQYALYQTDTTSGVPSSGDEYSIFHEGYAPPYLPARKLREWASTCLSSPPLPTASLPTLSGNTLLEAPYQRPVFFDWKSHTWKFYYPDLHGRPDTVWLSPIDSVANQALLDTTKKWFHQGRYFTFPQYLTMAEFIRTFRPSWAEALLVYHPEYIYLWECRRTIEPQQHNGLSTFAFDSLLLRRPDTLLNPTFAGSILNHDPFFVSTVANTLMGRRWMRPYDWRCPYDSAPPPWCDSGLSARMRMDTLLHNYMGSGLTLYQVAYLMTNCGASPPPPYDLRGDSEVAKEAAHLYIRLKEQVLMEFLHKRAMPCKAYNGVIGPLRFTHTTFFDSLPDTLSIPLDSFLTTAPSGLLPNADTIWWQRRCCNSSSIIGSFISPHQDSTQISNRWSYNILHLTKQKRWGRVDEFLGLDTTWFQGQIGQDTLLTHLTQCQCSPEAQALELFFRLLFEEGAFSTDTSFSLDSCSAFPGYLLGSLLGSFSSTFYQSWISPGGDTLYIAFSNASCELPGVKAQIRLAIPPTTPPVRWRDTTLLALQHLQYQGPAPGGGHLFTLSLWVYTDSLWKVPVQGQTCFNLSCPSHLSCDTTCFGRLILQLLDTLISYRRFDHPFTFTPPNPETICLCSPPILCKRLGKDDKVTPSDCLIHYQPLSSNEALLYGCCGYAFRLSFSEPLSTLNTHPLYPIRIPGCKPDMPQEKSCCTNTLVLGAIPDNKVAPIEAKVLYVCLNEEGEITDKAPLCLQSCEVVPPRPPSSVLCADIPPFPPLPQPPDTTSPCLTALIATATQNALIRYAQYLDSLFYGFKERYITHCRKVHENLTLRLPYEGDYYVLYLYDDVGNLLATVPPEGIRPLDSVQTAQVDAARRYFARTGTFAGGPQPIYPHHTKASHYRYNSANLQVAQYTPDGDTVRTFYDLALRPAASQNERQKDSSLYAYLKYDYKGRLIESGIGKTTSGPPTLQQLSAPTHPTNWLSSQSEIVRIVYDKPLRTHLPSGWIQRNLLGRISYQERDEDGNGIPEQRYAYDYDALGNVRSLYIYLEALRGYNLSSGWKRVEYVYDRISGKVDSVVYQRGEADQWLQAYRYDGLNRLVEVRSSRSGWPTSWRRDAHYRYYLHRPLGRIELGHWPVQGVDYLYTLNGWIKGLNSYSLSDTLDVSRDGNLDWRNPRRWVPRDVLAYEVLYYPGDYQPIGRYRGMSGFRNFVGLYNGNIGMSHIHQDTLSLLSRRYRYDALQRLRSVEVLEGLSFTPTPAYGERFTYDRDGNITRVLRYSSRGVMDSLRYHYYSPLRNWLSHVTDTVGAGAYSEDLDSQAPGNYRYDETGNLIEDISEGIQIHWTHYGKVWGIDSAGTAKLRFLYDASGNRVVKEYVPGRRREIYARDAQGNVLAVYEAVGESLLTKEFYIWGVQRLGYLIERRYLGRRCSRPPCPVGPPVPVQRVLGLPPGIGRPSVVADSVVELLRGSRRYELSDWLENVRVVVTDRRLGSLRRGYRAEVVGVGDYYSFGAEIRARSYEVALGYRWGYQAQEKDNEIYGRGASYYYRYRQHDARLGRFWSVDPLARKYPWNSPYAFAENRLVDGVEWEGLEWDWSIDDQGHISINVNVHFCVEDIDLSEEQVRAYKDAISTKWDEVLRFSFGEKFSGKVTFNEYRGGREQFIPTLTLAGRKELDVDADDRNMVGVYGETVLGASRVIVQDLKGDLRSSSSVALDAIHELLHTLRVAHPFEVTQAPDTRLVHRGGNDYSSINTTHPLILYNIMNYSTIRIDGKSALPEEMIHLTPGQLRYILNEIDMQKSGAGLPDRNPKFWEYWPYTPGEEVEHR